MKYLIRELSKFLMFAVSVFFPILLWRMSGYNNGYLWFYFLSAVMVTQTFSHFETIERLEAFTKIQETEKDEQKEIL